MFDIDFDKIADTLYTAIMGSIEFYLPKLIGALLILGFGILIALWIYKIVMYLFKKFKVLQLIDKLTLKYETGDEKEEKNQKIKVVRPKFTQKIKVNEVVSKAVAYYVFLVFFRFAIQVIGISEVELFLGQLLRYLPSLFIGAMIGFFGVRFSNFVYDVIYHGLNLSRQKTAKIIASGAKVIILFFTLMAVLDKIGIATEITNTILTGFIAMLTIAGGLAFGLGGKDIAHEILESFRK